MQAEIARVAHGFNRWSRKFVRALARHKQLGSMGQAGAVDDNAAHRGDASQMLLRWLRPRIAGTMNE